MNIMKFAIIAEKISYTQEANWTIKTAAEFDQQKDPKSNILETQKFFNFSSASDFKIQSTIQQIQVPGVFHNF